MVDVHSVREPLGAPTTDSFRGERSSVGPDSDNLRTVHGSDVRRDLEDGPAVLQLDPEHSGVGGQVLLPTEEVRAVHRSEGTEASGRHTSRSNGRGAVNKLLQGVVLASALGSALCNNYVGQVVSADSRYRSLEGPIFGDRVGIYHASSEAGPFTRAKDEPAVPQIPSR